MFKALLLLVLVASTLAINSNFRNDAHWSHFKVQFDKKYESEAEEVERYTNFLENSVRAERMSKLNPEATFGVTRFSDMSPAEFRARYLTFKTSEAIKAKATVQPVHLEDIPDSYNWYPSAVLPAKDQGQCGSCYIFSVVGNIESVNKVKGHELISLSEKQVLDCDTVDEGCNGGWMWNVYDYVIKAGGLESEKDYPYAASKGKCKFDKSKIAVSIDSYVNLTQKDEEGMRSYMYEHGALSIALDATPLQYYSSGIVTKGCGNKYDDLDHAVLAVGWGVQGSTKYWIVKNSWGKNWGESGFFRIERNKNTCGLAWLPTSSVIDH